MKFQELALWGTIGALLSAVGYNWDTWQFWCFLGTYWAVSQLSKAWGKVQGIIDYIDMTEQDQQRIRAALKDARSNAND
jgi:hypothetical protein